MNDNELAQWTSEMNRWCIARGDALEAACRGDHKLEALHEDRAHIYHQRAHDVISRILARRRGKLLTSSNTPPTSA
jgi:hypothetical protein